MDSGVIVAQVNKFNDILQGTVVEVGENSPYPLTVSKNDAVWFSEKDVKSTTMFNGKEYLVIREIDILGYTPA
jgi:co-chaperonin GroES (HSP10)